MVHFLEQPDFTLVIPGPEAVEWVRSMMEQGQKANREYLAYLEAAAQ